LKDNTKRIEVYLAFISEDKRKFKYFSNIWGNRKSILNKLNSLSGDSAIPYSIFGITISEELFQKTALKSTKILRHFYLINPNFKLIKHIEFFSPF